jgi:multiple sugar transport system ATP-binding protein
MASVSYINVTKQFEDGTEALKKLDLHITDGEFMVLVGPSGCGKSTALRLLAGLETVSSGELLIDDVVVNAMPPQQRNIAMVFQNYALYPHMTVRRNLAFPLRMMKLPAYEISKRTESVAKLLQLTDFLDRMPKQLSGGQRQRVAMGRAIVREPKVFLMDEPLSNLDAKLRVKIRTEIAALQQRLNITTIYVTHDQVEAMTLGDKVAVMNAGLLQQVDTPQTLYERPANTFVAGFIGNPGMNIFASRLEKSASGLKFEFAGQWLTIPVDARVKYDTLTSYVEQPIFIGLRPEAFELASTEDTTVALTLTTLEALGHEQLLYFDLPQVSEAHTIVRIQRNQAIAAGDIIPLRLNTRELYFFDQQGMSIYDKNISE